MLKKCIFWVPIQFSSISGFHTYSLTWYHLEIKQIYSIFFRYYSYFCVSFLLKRSKELRVIKEMLLLYWSLTNFKKHKKGYIMLFRIKHQQIILPFLKWIIQYFSYRRLKKKIQIYNIIFMICFLSPRIKDDVLR